MNKCRSTRSRHFAHPTSRFCVPIQFSTEEFSRGQTSPDKEDQKESHQEEGSQKGHEVDRNFSTEEGQEIEPQEIDAQAIVAQEQER